ncbi:mucolipin-3-like [Panonychus citri]|uniref:mucolipin-3-like n=1 Tax=Panonychus citri TaxID=50023 RepID=UPI002307061A|nr:mucolipin-3-like [Panonychus citri]
MRDHQKQMKTVSSTPSVVSLVEDDLQLDNNFDHQQPQHYQLNGNNHILDVNGSSFIVNNGTLISAIISGSSNGLSYSVQSDGAADQRRSENDYLGLGVNSNTGGGGDALASTSGTFRGDTGGGGGVIVGGGDDDDDDTSDGIIFPGDPGSAGDNHQINEVTRRERFLLSTTSYSSEARDSFRRELKYYFMNPIDKWRSKKKFPWKLLLQITKLIIVTIQIYTFGTEMSRFKTHQANMEITLRELLLSDWDPVREVMTYPPAAGPFACYTKSDLFRNIDFAIRSFANITNTGVGSFSYDSLKPEQVSPIYLDIVRFAKGEADPYNFSYNFNNENQIDRLVIDSPDHPAGDIYWSTFSIQTYLSSKSPPYSVNFDSLIKIEIATSLRTIYLNALDSYNRPECYVVDILIIFDNSLHAGQILMSLDAKSHHKPCYGNLEGRTVSSRSVIETITILVILLSFLSSLLCLRSMIKGIILRRRTIHFFDRHYSISLGFRDKSDFIDLWIYMIFVNDILLIIGSIIKLIGGPIDHSQSLNSNYSVLFGIGILLTWIGVLRYISFFDKFNVVILTVKKAFPDIIKFFLCAILLYVGFCLCGWIVLGPHHLKFRTPSETSECLFSLLNGDDMYATFATLATKDPVIWWFSRIYLYSFISLFIYVVLSLFISIIMDAWDIIKNYNPEDMTEMHRFIAECNDDVCDEILQEESKKSILRKVKSFFKFNSADTNPLLF